MPFGIESTEARKELQQAADVKQARSTAGRATASFENARCYRLNFNRKAISITERVAQRCPPCLPRKHGCQSPLGRCRWQTSWQSVTQELSSKWSAREFPWSQSEAHTLTWIGGTASQGHRPRHERTKLHYFRPLKDGRLQQRARRMPRTGNQSHPAKPEC